MKIRSHLVLLVFATVLPLVAFIVIAVKWTTFLMVGAAASAILAVALAIVFGGQVTRSICSLARVARGMATGEHAAGHASPEIAEFKEIWAAFDEAAERLRAQESALRESEERFRSMADAAPVLIWLSDADKKRTYFNRLWLEFTGRTPKQEPNDRWWKSVHPDDLSRCGKIFTRACDLRETFDLEYRLRRTDGEYRWVLERGSPRFSADGRFLGYIGCVVDITERKRAEESLRSSEERLRLAMQTGKVGVWDWDIAADRVLWTDSLRSIYGVDAAELKPAADAFAQLVHPEDLERVVEARECALRDENVRYELEFRAVRPDGEVIWLSTNALVVRENGRAVRMLGATMDITQRKRAEETVRNLLRTTEKLNSTLDLDTLLDLLVDEAVQIVNAESGFCGLATADGMVTRKYFLKGRAVPFEYSWQPMHGVAGWVLVHKVLYVNNDAAADPQMLPDLCGRFGIRSVLSVPILNVQREVIGFFEIHNKRHSGGFTDSDKSTLMAISEAAAIAIQNAIAYRNVQAAQESLRSADRRKDEYLAMLGHELRNPLGVISMTMQMQRMQPPAPEDVPELRDIVERQVRLMTRLLDDLLDVSRISRGQLRLDKNLVDFAAIVRESVEDYRSNLDANNVGVQIEIPERPFWVMGDQTRLAQIVANMLHNANKFTPAGGTVSIGLEENAAGTDVVLTVRDTGIGMEPEILSRVFEPFAQGKRGSERSRGGLGLGLALVKGLTELHGGEARATSRGPDQGSEIMVRLPLRYEAAPSAKVIPQSAPSARSRRVLVIEDDATAARTMELFLSRKGHAVEVAHSGREGVEAARRFKPEVILCDIGLPEFDGYQVAQCLRQEPAFKAVYIIGVSGYGHERDKVRAWQAGFNAYLVKPVNMSELETLLANVGRDSPPSER